MSTGNDVIQIVISYPLTAIYNYLGLSPAKFWPRSRQESWRVFGRQDCRDLTEISAAKNSPRFSSRFSTRSWRDLKISAAKNSPRFLPRSQSLVEIPAKISTRSQNLSGQKLAKNLDKISSKILGRSQSLGGQNLAENLGKTSSKISLRYQHLGGQKNLAEKTRGVLSNVYKIF